MRYLYIIFTRARRAYDRTYSGISATRISDSEYSQALLDIGAVTEIDDNVDAGNFFASEVIKDIANHQTKVHWVEV